MPSSSGRRDPLEALPAVKSIDVEVIVEGEDSALPEFFSESNEGGIRKIHRSVGVLIHESRASLDSRRLKVRNLETVGIDEPPECPVALGTAGPGEQIHRFGERRPGRNEWQLHL